VCDRPSNRSPAVCDRPSNRSPAACDRPSNRSPAVWSSLQSSTSCVWSSLQSITSCVWTSLQSITSCVWSSLHLNTKLESSWQNWEAKLKALNTHQNNSFYAGEQVMTCLFTRVICGESPKVNQRRWTKVGRRQPVHPSTPLITSAERNC
jgi:hypothetical protein